MSQVERTTWAKALHGTWHVQGTIQKSWVTRALLAITWRSHRGLGWKLLSPRAGRSLLRLFSSMSVSNCPRVLLRPGSRGNPLRAEPVLHILSLYACKGGKECWLGACCVLPGLTAFSPYMVGDFIILLQDQEIEIPRGEVTCRSPTATEVGFKP